MTRSWLAAVAVVAIGCGSRSLPPKQGEVPDDVSGELDSSAAAQPDAGASTPQQPPPPPLLKATSVRLVLDGSRIALSLEHETGAVEPLDVGDYGAPCALAGDRSRDAGPATRATWAVDCVGSDERGLAIRLVYRAPNLIVMRAPLVPGDTEELEFEVDKQIPMPQGGQIDFVEP